MCRTYYIVVYITDLLACLLPKTKDSRVVTVIGEEQLFDADGFRIDGKKKSDLQHAGATKNKKDIFSKLGLGDEGGTCPSDWVALKHPTRTRAADEVPKNQDTDYMGDLKISIEVVPLARQGKTSYTLSIESTNK